MKGSGGVRGGAEAPPVVFTILTRAHMVKVGVEILAVEAIIKEPDLGQCSLVVKLIGATKEHIDRQLLRQSCRADRVSNLEVST